MSSGRSDYGDAQAALLAALLRGEPVPAGFDPDAVAAAAAALVRKRSALVREAWPAVVHGRGERFAAEFAAYCRRHPPPAEGDGVADGFRYARELSPAELSEAGRVELALRRSVLAVRDGRVARRRAPLLSAVRLRSPPGLLLVAALPPLGAGHLTLGRR